MDFGLTSAMLAEEIKKKSSRQSEVARALGYNKFIFFGSVIVGVWIGADTGKPGMWIGDGFLGAIVGVILIIGNCCSTDRQLKPREEFTRYNNALARYEQDVLASAQAAKAAAEAAVQAVQLAEKRKREEFWYSLSGWEFEKHFAKLMEVEGYSATVTKGSGDGGIDIELRRSGVRTIVQCKRYRDPIGPKDVRELYGVFCSEENCKESILVGLGGFTEAARQFATRKPIRLLSMEDVLRMANGTSLTSPSPIHVKPPEPEVQLPVPTVDAPSPPVPPPSIVHHPSLVRRKKN